MKLYIKPENDLIISMYENHSHYHPGDSGIDLYIPERIVVQPRSFSTMIDLKIKCEATLDDDSRNTSYYLYPRSSISKTPLRFANSVGIIDAGYRGTIKAAVDNPSDEAYIIEEGTRLFQLCGPTLEPIEFTIVNVLSNTERGEGGFGSTD
jgi:dUTP pyrophosphatase